MTGQPCCKSLCLDIIIILLLRDMNAVTAIVFRCCTDLQLKPNLEVDVEIQFQMNRLLFCQMHHALDLLRNVDVIFPDISKVVNFVTIKHKSASVAV